MIDTVLILPRLRAGSVFQFKEENFMYCTKCGVNNPVGATYCTGCRNLLGADGLVQPLQGQQNPILEEPVSVKEWLLLFLLLLIPIAGLVMLFVWGFGKEEKRSKANYCKAYLIYLAITTALVIMLYVAMFVFVFALAGSAQHW